MQVHVVSSLAFAGLGSANYHGRQARSSPSFPSGATAYKFAICLDSVTLVLHNNTISEIAPEADAAGTPPAAFFASGALIRTNPMIVSGFR
jgi:hypothetical protein